MKDSDEKLVDELLAIAERISNAKISDTMKDSIFGHVLKQHKKATPPSGVDSDGGGNDDDDGGDFKFNGTVNKFLRTYKLSEADIAKVFHLEPDAVDFVIPKLKVKTNVKGVHHCILLIGLKNALQSGKYAVVINEVRKLAANFGVYDSTNFAYAMKKNSRLLKNYKAGKDTELSGVGIRAASELISELVAE